MKYAFIIGSNAFVVPSNVVSYRDHNENKAFLKINSIYHEGKDRGLISELDCDINISDADGTAVNVVSNKLQNAPGYKVAAVYDSVMVTRADGSTLIHIHQLDEDTAMSLEHNIIAELEVNMPIAVIRIFGDFMLDDLHIIAENEKLFINEDGWGNSVRAGEKDLRFSDAGVLL